MRSHLRAVLAVLCAAVPLAGQADSIEVGSQAPNPFSYGRFVLAYTRNDFYTLVSSPPATHVQKIGANGLIQLFYDTAKTTGIRLALVKADAAEGLSYDSSGQIISGDVFQITTPMFTYVASVNGGSETAPANFNVTGFPRGDTQQGGCGFAPCYYQFFDKNYALFSVLASEDGAPAGQYQVKGTFYIQWRAGNDVSGFGAPVTNEAEITSALSGTKADWQQYRSGYLFRLNSGTASERFISVTAPAAEFYTELGGPAGSLGLPLETPRTMPDGRLRQSFEGGTLEYRAGERPILLLPVQQVLFDGVPTAGTIQLRRGESIEVRVRLLDSSGNELTGRVVNWVTSNGRIVSVEASGYRATLRAVGAGLATITAISEGKRSTALTVTVASQCCEIGEGAPNSTVSQAIQETIRRNRLNVRIPTGMPVQRLGAGYYQEFSDLNTGAPYLVAVPDPGATGFLVKGEILGRLDTLGGLAGPLGYPSTEETPGGRQMFSARYALAGRPVRVVQAPLLDRWALSGYETGPFGPPASNVAQSMTFTGALAVFQYFRSGMIAAAQGETRSYAVSEPFFSRFVAMGGVEGDLGLPAGEEVVVDGVRRQNFEGGSLSQPGAGEISALLEPRKPRVLISPNPVTAGSRVRIAAGGFPSGATLKITAGADAEFEAAAANGAFAWETPVPVNSPPATVRVVATGPDGLKAEGSYRIRSVAEAEPRLLKVSGDLQTGPPGALLAAPLVVSLRDAQGAPISGVAVTFQPAPGTSVERASATTGPTGEASAWMRLPDQEGVALATATAAGRVVTFSARASNTVLPSFPGLSQDYSQSLGASSAPIREEGALLASAANILRFYQDRGLLASPNGLAEPLSLNAFLKDYCPASSAGGTPRCDGFFAVAGGEHAAVNLARVPAFAGGGAVFEFGSPRLETIRDWIAQGDPVLLALRMSANSAPAGMHYVVARGIAANGGILVFDSSPIFGRASLNDLLNDFTAGGRTWRGSLASAARLARRPPGPNAFYFRSAKAFQIASPQGACQPAQEWLDRPASLSSSRQPSAYWFALCDGPATGYQIDLPGEGSGQVDAASAGAGSSGSYSARLDGPAVLRVRTSPAWSVSRQIVELDPDAAVVNAANLQPALAPGSLMSIFGEGLTVTGGALSIQVAGLPLPPVASSPFRVTVWLPPDLPPGRHPVIIENSLGRIAFDIEVLAAAPSIFLDETGSPVITSVDGRPVTSLEPAARGSDILIYATGLGAVANAQASTPVSAEIDGNPAPVRSVEFVPEQPGVYRVRVGVPVQQAPGSGRTLVLKQGGAGSPSAPLAIR